MQNLLIEMLPCDGMQPPQGYENYVTEVRNDMNIGSPWQVRADGFPKRSIPGETGDNEVAKLAKSGLEDYINGHGTERVTENFIHKAAIEQHRELKPPYTVSTNEFYGSRDA